LWTFFLFCHSFHHVYKLFVFIAAHCFKNKGERLSNQKAVEHTVAIVGKHDFGIYDEEGSANHSIFEVILHPEWNMNTYAFDADISIVVLRDPVTMTLTVGKICLPEQSNDEVVGTGTIAGWGKSQASEKVGNGPDTIPNELELPAVDNITCWNSNHDLYGISSPRTFCAGFVNQSKSACSGDSGGGFYLRSSTKFVWELRGIVSASIRDPYRGCDINAYGVFTNVAKFVDWIKIKMEETNEIKWKEVSFMCKVNDDG
jgi:secreted trypsin-like serine protease